MVNAVLCRADWLMSLGDTGRGMRDSANEWITTIALAAVWAARGTCNTALGGLIVCLVTRGIDLGFAALPISFRGGTTYGNVFITKDKDDLDNVALLGHELIHTYQWAAAEKAYPALYGLESARSVRATTTVDWKAGIKWTIGGPVPYLYPDITPGNTVCRNRFEMHAGFAAGGYPECL